MSLVGRSKHGRLGTWPLVSHFLNTLGRVEISDILVLQFDDHEILKSRSPASFRAFYGTEAPFRPSRIWRNSQMRSESFEIGLRTILQYPK